MAREYTYSPGGGLVDARCAMFESLSEMRAWIQAKQGAGKFIPSDFGINTAALDACLKGDASLVARADKLLASIEAASPLANVRAENVRAVTGSLADVPAYLAGVPSAMRRRVKAEAPKPLTIVVNTSVSASQHKATIERRGVAVLALLRLLESAGHAIELYVHSGTGGGGNDRSAASLTFCQIESKPLDLARACWALSSEQYCRQVSYGTDCTLLGQNYPGWPWGTQYWIKLPETKQAALVAGAMGRDVASVLYVKGLASAGAQVFNNDAGAAQWVADQYALALAMGAEQF